ncbi:MAG: fumarate/nitrate reduction transcriptional regulator Fnr [Porticoccaceae bacterium]|nr:fumarate/nitrate reduction transcriptional regulator Fnr [Porticoccaceae bacterium]
MRSPILNIQPSNCHNCRMSALCLPLALDSSSLDRLDKVIERGRPIHKNKYIFHGGDPFRAVYAIRSGVVKSFCISDDGSEQVTGFYLPGEIFGWDGIDNNTHSNTATTLETTALCEIPFARFEEISRTMPILQKHFMRLMAKELTSDQELIGLLAKSSAEERVASLLLSLSSRLKRQHLSATQFRLPMSRADIGNYLGLTVETVSRVFSRFQSFDLILCDKKEIEIINLNGLSALAHKPKV